MNASKVALLLVSVLFLSVQAEASCSNIPASMLFASAGGDKGGNAGNGMEILFRAKADEVLDWVKRNRLREIDTRGLDKNELSDRLLTQKWRVCMSDEPVYVDGRERTCRNSFDPLEPGLIECSSDAFRNRETDESRYALVFHELLGVAGVERNLENESDDSISRQILKFIGMKASPYLSDKQVQESVMAETRVYRDGNHLNAELMNESEAKILYDGLNVEPTQGRSGTAKFFYSKDRKASVYCSHGLIPGGIHYSCMFSISDVPVSSSTRVYEKDGFLHASLNDETDAKALYEALDVGTLEGRSGEARYFYAEDRKASVYCSHGEIPTSFYGCEISIEKP